MFGELSVFLRLLQANRNVLRTKIHRALIFSLIAPIFVTISAPPSLALPNTPTSSTPEVKSPFTAPSNLKSVADTAQSANLNNSGLMVRFDAKTYASYSGTGTTWSDISGNSKVATFVNKTSPLTSDYTAGGVTFKGIGFNGSNHYATINSDFSGSFPAISVSFYANLGTAQNWERIIDIGDRDSAKNILVARSGTSQSLVLEIYNGATTAGQCAATNALTDNEWAHWAIVADGTNCKVYKNGTAWSNLYNTKTAVTSTNGTLAYTGLPENATRANAYIGKSNWSGDALFEGAIADLAIFNRALTATEVGEWKVDQMASTVHAGSGVCPNRVANPASAVVTSVGGDCVVKFTAPSNTTTSNTWIVPSGVTTAKVLTVAGGGGGGAWVGGGGGAGGFIESATTVSATTALGITVGAGGAGGYKIGAGTTVSAAAGANSVFGTSFTALGGGFGAAWDIGSSTGGSGGGGSSEGSSYPTGAATTNAAQGFAGGSKNANCNWDYGYPNGGGGGAGAVGGSATCFTYSSGKSGAGGIGRASDVTGTSTFYAGGGGGGIHGNGVYRGVAGAGGSGGGGSGAAWNDGVNGPACAVNPPPQPTGGNGADNFGGGGGGSGAPSANGCNSYGGRGGSGVVIIRYGTTSLSINSNGGSGFTGTTSFSGTTFSNVTLPAQSGLTRSGFTFGGWNTSADGSGVTYAASVVYQLNITTTLYAQWRSVISYDANGATTSRTLETTSALGSAATTTLGTGRMSNGSLVSTGLQLHLDASNPTSYSGTGSTWYDISGNGRNATAVNSPTFDAVTKSFLLNGTNQYFEFPISEFAYSGSNNYTLATMFKTSNLAKVEQCLICRYQGGTAGSYLLRIFAGVPETFREGVNTFYAAGSTVGSSEYDYLVTTFNGSTIKIFINGAEVYSANNSAALSASTSIRTNIGRTSDNLRYFEGQIFSAQIYNVALTQDQIIQNYKALLPKTLVNKDSSTLSGWSTTADSSTSVIVGNNGTLLAGLPTPYIRLEAKNYNGTTWTPTNYTGNGITFSSVKPTANANQKGWGATATFPTVSGVGASKVAIYLNNPELPSYTFCAMARYKTTGITLPASTGRIFSGTESNWFSGWFFGTKEFHHNDGWVVDSTGIDYNWHYVCDSGNNIYWDGVKLTSTPKTYTKFPTLAIGGAYRDTDWADFEVSEVILYDQFLSASQIAQVNQYFKSTYGIVAGAVETATPNMVPPNNFASTGTSTLYARWGSTITYDGNGQTSGTPPVPQVLANGAGNLATNSGALIQAGYNFVGWNTRADGTGTLYLPSASYSGPNLLLYAIYQVPVKFTNTLAAAEPITLSPYMRFKASDYDAAKKLWYDSSGNGRSTSYVRGAPTVTTTSIGNGSTKTFTTVQGGTADGIRFNNTELSANSWTIFSVARYNGTQSGLSRIFDAEYGNFLFGFYNSASGVAHYGAWVTGTGNVHGTNWVQSTGYTDAYRSNGVLRGTGNATDTLPPLTINAGGSFATEPSAWQVAETIIFDRKLTLAEIQKVEDYLAATYGISGYTNQQSYTESTTVNAVAGSTTISDTFTASFGYRNAFTVSPIIPGISIESTVANNVRIRIANTVASGTYWETITVTDGAGNAALFPVRIEVVPALQWSASNPSTVTTTFGKSARIKLDLSGGFGTRIAAVTHASTPAPRGITIDSTSIASGFIYLVVDTGTAVGTYTESISVTDGSGLVKATILTLTINSPPDITYSAQSDAVFPYVTQNLLVNLDAANPNSYSGSGTTWTDTAGGRAFTLSGSPTYSQSTGGTLAFASGKEATSNTSWTNLETFTVETWFKLNSLAASSAYPCFATSTYTNSHINFSICQWNTPGTIGAGYHVGGVGWQGNITKAGALTTNTWYHAVYTVSKSGTTYTATLYLNGVSLGSATSTYAPQTQAGALRVGKRWDTTTDYVDGDIPVVRIYNAPLTDLQVLQNYQNSKVRFLSATSASPTNSGSTALTVTARSARDFQLFTANDGVGNKTFTLSGVNSNFRIDTSTANTAIFKSLATTEATSASSPKIYYETLTALDSNSVATAYYLTITANPVLLITTTTDTVTTTFGRSASVTLNVAVNTGSGTSNFTRVSSSGSSAITATFAAGQAILNIAGTLPEGTYYETLTATDSVGATALKVIKIVVNPALAITPASVSGTLETTFTRATSVRLNVSGGTGNRTFAISYPSSTSPWRITLDTSTAGSGYVTLNSDSFTATGTHTITVSVSDSVSSTASTNISLIVNDFPVINNVKNENSYTKPGLTLNLDAANTLSSTGSGNWNDLSGAGSSVAFTSAPTYSATNGGIFTFNGTSNYLTVPSITTATSPGVTNGSFNEYTAEVWVKFNSASVAGTACLICEGYTGSSGSMNMALSISGTGRIHAGYLPTTPIGWVETYTAVGTVSAGNWYHIASTVVKNGSNYTNTIYINGVAITSRTSTEAPATSSLNYYIGRRWDSATQLFSGSIGVVRVYNRGLSQSQIQDNYSALSTRYLNTSALTSTITTTQGSGYSATAIPAVLGTGNKTLTLLPVLAGITADTSTANSIQLNIGTNLFATDTQTARTYLETITATDQAGASTRFAVNIVVNPPVLETSTAPILTNVGGVITHILTTTSGIETSTVIYASKGSSAKTFSRVGTSTSGVTLTPSGDQATLRVLSTINPGTYWETITATDTTSATFNLVFKIVVNPGPTIVGRNTLTATTSTAFTSVGYYVANGTGALKLTMTPNITGITLDTSTAGVAYIKLTNAFTSAGTYLETLTVTDANGATGRLPVTIKVVGPVELSGATSVTSVYGDSNLFSYNVSGGGITKFNVMVAGSCITSKSTYSSNGTTYTVEQLTGSNSSNTCSWVVPAGVTSVTGLVIAGGGQGGAGRGGGGGAGAVESGTITVTPGETLTVRIGVGGSNASCTSANAAAGCDGTDTIIDRSGTPNYIVAKGGGGGGGHLANSSGRAGGSGGGAGMNYATTAPSGGSVLTNTVPSGWTAYGNVGVATSDTETAPTNYRNTGGGGGAGGTGFPGVCKDKTPVCNSSGTGGGFQPDGGEGISISITGSPVVYAGGGGGAVGISVTEAGTGSYLSAQPGNYRASGAMASKGGAGIGASPASPEGTKASPNTGSGGGGSITGAGGNGASGLVVFRYVAPTAAQPNNRISFDLVDATTGRFNMTVPESITVGSYSQSVYLTDANDAGSIYRTATITVNVIQDTPTVTVSLPGAVTTAKYGTPVTLSAAASTNGNINFKKNGTTITNCGTVLTSGGLASCSWTPTMVETTTITAELTPTDSLNYRKSIEIDSLLTVVVGKADTLTVTANTPSAITYSETMTLPANGYITNGLKTIDSITAMSYIYSTSTGTTCALGGRCAVGDIGPAGGVVFYVSPTVINAATGISSGGKYLEAAPSSTSATYRWCNYNSTFLNASASSIGDGAETTRITSEACTSGAAKTAADLTQAGFSDWFLPSYSEIIEMSKIYSQIGMSGGTYYWTSSEYDSSFGYANAPTQSAPSASLKTALLRIWPIRAFTDVLMTSPPTDAGTYYIYPATPTFNPGAASNYASIQYLPGTLVINKAPRNTWSATYNAGTNATRYGAGKTETATMTYPGDGTKLFTTNSSVCSVGSETGTITTIGVGSCSLQVSLSETKNWLSDTKTVTVRIDRGLRTATIAPAQTTIRYGESTTVTSTITPALDSATVTYSVGSFLGCSTDNVSGVVTGTKAGASCAVSVSYSQTALYESATASAAMTINKALAPVVTTETITAVSYKGSSAQISPTFSVRGIAERDILQILPTADVTNISSISARTYSSVANYKYFATTPTSYDSTTAPSLGGTYSVKPQSFSLLNGLDMSNYETPTYASSNLIITPIAQTPLKIALSTQESITVPYDITFTGGSSSGLVSALIISGGSATGCSITELRLNATSPGKCVLQARKAADRNYLEVVSDTATVTILNFVSNIDWNSVFSSGSVINVASEVPIVTGPITCDTGCIPVITDIRDSFGVSTVTLKVGFPLQIIGSDLNTTTFVYFTARINGVRLSSVLADTVTIDSDNRLTVMAPTNFLPNTGQNSSNIAVRIVVMTPGGQTASSQIVIISLI